MQITISQEDDCFNEAPAILPGKAVAVGGGLFVAGTASMRPRRFCRGKVVCGSMSR